MAERTKPVGIDEDFPECPDGRVDGHEKDEELRHGLA
jgi:hypothetical protein